MSHNSTAGLPAGRTDGSPPDAPGPRSPPASHQVLSITESVSPPSLSRPTRHFVTQNQSRRHRDAPAAELSTGPGAGRFSRQIGRGERRGFHWATPLEDHETPDWVAPLVVHETPGRGAPLAAHETPDWVPPLAAHETAGQVSRRAKHRMRDLVAPRAAHGPAG